MLELCDIVIASPSGWKLEADRFAAPAGALVAVAGANGSGKTTLLRVLAGLLRPSRGAVLLDGRTVTGRRSLERALRRQAVLVHQHPYLFDRSVADNILWGLRARGVRGERARAACVEAARRAGVEHLLDRPARALSGGETQRVAIARALVLRPRFLLLDEPTSAADPENAERIGGLLARRDWAPEAAIIITTHTPERLPVPADRTYAIDQGRLIAFTAAARHGEPAPAPVPPSSPPETTPTTPRSAAPADR